MSHHRIEAKEVHTCDGGCGQFFEDDRPHKYPVMHDNGWLFITSAQNNTLKNFEFCPACAEKVFECPPFKKALERPSMGAQADCG